MKTIFLAGSKIGQTTLTSMRALEKNYIEKYPNHTTSFIDLAEKNMVFSDGRNYLDYDGDTHDVLTDIMSADIIFIGSPTFQASIPATLKNIFDLLPQKALEHKTVAIIMTAGSDKHYLVAEMQLKPILSYMKANIVPRYLFVNNEDVVNKQIINDDVLFRLSDLVDNTVTLATSYALIQKEVEESYGF